MWEAFLRFYIKRSRSSIFCGFLTTGTDPSRSFRMTINVSLIMTLFHPIVILNGGKNALWERRKNGIVARSEESITLMTFYCLPHHGNRSFAIALDNILPYSPSRRQILHVRSGWRLTFPSLWRSFIQLSFWTGVRMPCEKAGKRNSGMEWRIYYPDDVLPSSSLR